MESTVKTTIWGSLKTVLKEKKNFLLLAYPLGILILILSKTVDGFAENIWARGVYKAYRAVMATLTGLLPFSLAEVILVLLIPAIMTFVIIFAIKLIRKKGGRLTVLFRGIRTAAVAVGLIWLAFMVGCGCNYYRSEIKDIIGLEVKDSSVDELTQLCAVLAARASVAREEMTGPDADPTQVWTSSYTNSERAEAAKDAMEKLSVSIPELSGVFPEPKSVGLSRLLSSFDITGFFFPWTVESNLNVDVPDYSRAVTACHELSYIAGIMREDEANFLAFLGCRESGDNELIYSGYMLAYILASNRLYAVSPEAYTQAAAYLSPGARTDLAAGSLYWDRFRDTAAYNVGSAMNNAYLKANNQTDGTRSYGRMVDLLLALMRRDKTI